MTVNDIDYEVIRLLGKGKGGYSYLVTDGNKLYVLKQIHHEPCEYYQFGDKLGSELRDYRRLLEIGIPMPKLLTFDRSQERLLKEFIDGPSIFDLVQHDQMQQDYFDQIQSMCEILYANELNIDYFPTNFIVQYGKLYYIDYECNSYMQQWDFEHWGIRYWSKTAEFLEYCSK